MQSLEKPLDREKVIHMTDLSFAKSCEVRFGLNKGVFNTIDMWFYERGVTHILERRQTILKFLETIHDSYKPAGRIRFGPGGLTAKLNEFWKQQME